MNYTASLTYLNSFINHERIQNPKQKWKLDPMHLLLRAGGYPQKGYRRVLIAGTKGKGSTGFFLETLLENFGVKTGFYSSPHLNDPRERIRIRGRMVSKEQFAKGLSWVRGVILSRSEDSRLKADPSQKTFRMTPSSFTYFEVMTLLAAYLFKQANIEIGIFEVGLGGRLDATNALDHELSVITPVHLDHESFLGNTIAKIAGEKAAIIRSRSKVVVSPQATEGLRVIKAQAKRQKALLIEARPLKAKLPLIGRFQAVNAGTALAAAGELGFKGRASWRPAGIWPGRMEWLNNQVLIDGAHNPMAVSAVAGSLREEGIKNPVIVFGTSRDKNAPAMLKTLSSLSSEIIVTPISNPRTLQLSDLVDHARSYFPLVFPTVNVQDAFRLAKLRAGRRKILTLGSFYLIGDLRKDFYA